MYRQVAVIVQEFKIFQCAECAKKVKAWLKSNGISGTHLKLTTKDLDDFILSDRWDGNQIRRIKDD
ncbi:MAG: hypothetical protein HC769_12945 [Cyanobacteria bacterium CRU_2_1]|nr:hypothetical protein [Cyanobacteria bacterium CRU_2_1]